jgi:hypothetical protein
MALMNVLRERTMGSHDGVGTKVAAARLSLRHKPDISSGRHADLWRCFMDARLWRVISISGQDSARMGEHCMQDEGRGSVGELVTGCKPFG